MPAQPTGWIIRGPKEQFFDSSGTKPLATPDGSETGRGCNKFRGVQYGTVLHCNFVKSNKVSFPGKTMPFVSVFLIPCHQNPRVSILGVGLHGTQVPSAISFRICSTARAYSATSASCI